MLKMNEKHIKKENHAKEVIDVSYCDVFLIIVSLLAIVIDAFTDAFVAVEYYQSGHKTWAWITVTLIFIPALIVQLVSLRWYMVDSGGNAFICIIHCLCFGLVHRYYYALHLMVVAKKSKDPSDYQKVLLAQGDLSLLHLFESFLESAPQLVLQLYILSTFEEIRGFTVVSAAASVFSISFSLVSYSRAQRIAYKDQQIKLPSLIFQVLWRLGMLTARIYSLILLILCFQLWFLLFISVHWLSMFLWILYQNTDLCDTKLEERCYNGIVAVIYCFCFFNLKDGRSRWRILPFYLLLLLENLTSLTIFLMWHAEDTPTLDVIAFIAVVGGTLVGFASMATYYRFFHPSAPILLCGQDKLFPTMSQEWDTLNMRSLKRSRRLAESPNSVQTGSINVSSNMSLSNSKLVLTDSVVIVEESDMEEINTLQCWLKEAVSEQEQMKQRGDYSPQDFDEVASSILSAHDYENLAAVNITRAGGLRHWRGYFDIETYLHDDSIVRDTLTSTTGSSSQDYLDTIVEDYQFCKLSADPVGMFAPSSLDTILEEVESICSEPRRPRGSCTLVATIDQIRITTPVQDEQPRGVRRKFSLIREQFEPRKDTATSTACSRDRSQSPLRVSVKELRTFFLRQVLTPPKLAALRKNNTTQPIKHDVPVPI